jgi:hypothetical protein
MHHVPALIQQVVSMHQRKESLSAEDRKAIDLLLDQGASTADLAVVPHAPVVAPNRIAAASKVLQLLSHLPEVDPPADLVPRTMRRIDEHIAANAARRPARPRATTHLQ